MKFLITGGCGFIGSNFIRKLLEFEKKSFIINVDAMRLGSNPKSLSDIKNPRYSFVRGNICDRKLMEKLTLML